MAKIWDGDWLNVRPVGLPGNKAATNSQIRVYEAGTEHLLWFEEVLALSKQAQQNYYAFDQLERHYGLGARTSVDVTITFYPSGTTVRKDGAMADSTIVIGEDGTNGVVAPPNRCSRAVALRVAEHRRLAAVLRRRAAVATTGGAPNGGVQAGNVAVAGSAQANGEASESDSGCGCRFGASQPGSLRH